MSFFAILVASLVGSPHCAGMCGGFVALYSGAQQHRRTPLSHIAYHLGRLCTYVLLGGTAGYIGAHIDDMGAIIGLQRLSTYIVGVLLITWGVVKFFPKLFKHVSIKFGAHAPFRHILKKYSGVHPALFALLLGLSSTLLPCGWLYLFVVTAAGSGSLLNGATVMAVFWIGTVPMLSLVSIATRFLTASVQRYVPRVTAGIIILAGILSLSGHLGYFPLGDQHSHCNMHE